jgi:hypothetical protein
MARMRDPDRIGALSVAVLVVVITEAGVTANLAAVGVGTIGQLGVRGFHGPPIDRLGNT